LISAVILALTSAAIWFVFLRSVPVSLATGVIAAKHLKPAGTYWQYPGGATRSFYTANPIPIEECYVFEIQVDGFAEPFRTALNKLAGESFQPGQRVRVQYEERGVPPFWRRAYVLDMIAEDSDDPR
jgi:hypothetical protein